ncbi:MAG: hypothetical protein IKA61_04080 [Clostridia bacterium]|nr:hypothetical protein [Clostridia bacterium]
MHHFENGVWIYGCNCLEDIKRDMAQTLKECIFIEPKSIKTSLLQRVIRSVVRIFAPLL